MKPIQSTGISLKKPTILIKYGGNAMISPSLQGDVLTRIRDLQAKNLHILLVHGGGPFINRALEKAGIPSEFIAGHRYTSEAAMEHIERALLSEVNRPLVNQLNKLGVKAIGLSGKDGQLAQVEKRESQLDGRSIDLGRVGDVKEVNVAILKHLLDGDILPVIACIGADRAGTSYNVNADMMAGAIAGAMQVDVYCVLTDVDGLRTDKDDPETLVSQLSLSEHPDLPSFVQGGMIPKFESCSFALKAGAKKALILNGTDPESLILKLIHQESIGTEIIL